MLPSHHFERPRIERPGYKGHLLIAWTTVGIWWICDEYAAIFPCCVKSPLCACITCVTCVTCAACVQERLPGVDWKERHGPAGVDTHLRRSSPIVEISLILVPQRTLLSVLLHLAYSAGAPGVRGV